MRAPAILLAIPLTVGCVCGLLVASNAGLASNAGFASNTGEGALALVAACAAAAGLLALVGGVSALASGNDATLECTVCLITGACLVGVSSGVDASIRAYRSPLYVWFDAVGPMTRPVMLRGTLREDAALTQTGVSLLVAVREVEPCSPAGHAASGRQAPCATRGGVRLSVTGTLAPGAMGEWLKGRDVRVAASLREPTRYWNPGVPDEQRTLARRGIALVGSVKSAAMVEVIARGSRLDEWTSAFRAWVRSVLAATVAPWSARSAGVAAAIAIGDRTGVAQADEERLQAAGTYHVIAISGGNIAILTLLLIGAGRWLGASPRIGAGAAIIVLLSYGQVTGPAPSVDRAVAAAVLFLAGRLVEQRGPSTNILAVAATIALSTSPMAVVDPGFLLSFGATLGILIGVPRLTRSIGARRKRTPRSFEAIRRLLEVGTTVVAATAAAEIVLAPMGAALFGRVTCAGLLLNLAAIPLMTVVQAGSFAALGAWLVDPDLARACGYIVHVAARGLVDSARLVDFAPWLSRELAPPAWGVLAAYYGALLLSLLPTRASRAAAAVTALVGILMVVAPHAVTRDGVSRPPRGWLRLVFLDVGQGDATLLALPDGRAYLVDAGGLPAAPLQDPTDGPVFDIGGRVVSRALRAFGVRSLDTFVLTHGDPDHVGGAGSVIRSFRPRAIWEGVPVPPQVPLQWLAQTADRIGAEWRTVQAGDQLRVGDVDLHVLHPPRPEWERQRVRNDDSVVLAVRFGKVSVIVPGDIGRDGEAHALGHVEQIGPTSITVLKAPHHGSATSSTREFLERLQPAAVIFSSGRANRFGHPSPVVVERYRAMGTTMFSTAEDGAVILDTDGERVEIRTSSGRAVTLEAPAPPTERAQPRVTAPSR